MKIVIAGGTGFLGQALSRAFAAGGHQITVLARRPAPAAPGTQTVAWSPDDGSGTWASSIDGADAVVNLAGEPIGGKRWSPAQKQQILESRIRATRSLVDAITSAHRPPTVFVSGSAIGYYGPLGSQAVTEDARPGADFLAGVCVKWEDEARRADGRTRVVLLRTGLVVEKDGGALARMLTPFKLGLGGPLGTGKQYYSWIHRDDWVRLAQWTIETDDVRGAVNVTAPNPVTNAEFTRALARALHRPAILPAPAFALRLALGEMADGLLLSGQRVLPRVAERHGFQFKYPDIDEAFRAIFA